MARQVITTLIDDLDGKKADRTVEFSLDGVAYTAAEVFLRLAKQSAAEGHRFRVALSGGSTPKLLYDLLASEARQASLIAIAGLVVVAAALWFLGPSLGHLAIHFSAPNQSTATLEMFKITMTIGNIEDIRRPARSDTSVSSSFATP